MSLVESDYDTFLSILLSVISESSNLDDLLPDLELCLSSLIESGILPGSAADRTNDFLEKLYPSVVKPLAFKSLPSQIRILLLKLGVAGFQRLNFQMAESACHLLLEGPPAYASDFKVFGGFEVIESAFLREALNGDFIYSGASILLKLDSEINFDVVYAKAGACLVNDYSKDPKLIRIQNVQSLLSDFLSRSKLSVPSEWLTLLGLMLASDLFDHQLMSLRYFSQFCALEFANPPVEWFGEYGLDSLLTLTLHSEFCSYLRVIYRFLAHNSIISIDFISILWEGQPYQHLSLLATYYGIFEGIAEGLQVSLADPFIDLMLKPPERNLDWLRLVSNVANILKTRDDLVFAFSKCRDAIAYYALGEAHPAFQQLARNAYIDIAAQWKNDAELSEFIQTLLSGPHSGFVLHLLNAIIQSRGISDESQKEMLVKLAIDNVSNSDNRNIAFLLLSNLIIKSKAQLGLETFSCLFCIEGNENFILKLIRERLIPDDRLENIFITLPPAARSTFTFVKTYIETRNNFESGLTSLPFVGEDVLWYFIRIPNSHCGFRDLLVDSYRSNEFTYISSDFLIETFINRWRREFETGPRRELIRLLDRFVTAIDAGLDPDRFFAVPHKVNNTRVDITVGSECMSHPCHFPGERASMKAIALVHALAFVARMPANALMLTGTHGVIPLEAPVCEHGSPDKSGKYTFGLVVVPENQRRFIPPRQSQSPGAFLRDSNLMDMLVDHLMEGSCEIIELMNHLPTSVSILNRLRAIPMKCHFQLSELFPSGRPAFFQYVLSSIDLVEGLAEQLLQAGLCDCLTAAVRKIDSGPFLHEIISFIDKHFVDAHWEKYALQLFTAFGAIVVVNMNGQMIPIVESSLVLLEKCARYVTVSRSDTIGLKDIPIYPLDFADRLVLQFTPHLTAKIHATGRISIKIGSSPEEINDQLFRFPGLRLQVQKPMVNPPIGTAVTNPEMVLGIGFTEEIVLPNFIRATFAADSVMIQASSARILAQMKFPFAYFLPILPFINAPSHFCKALTGHVENGMSDIRKCAFDGLRPRSSYLPIALCIFKQLSELQVLSETEFATVFQVVTSDEFLFEKVPNNDSLRQAFEFLSTGSDDYVLQVCKQIFNSGFSFRFPEKVISAGIPGISGLQNLRQTCFLNATLQQFFAIRGFRNAVLMYSGSDPLLTELKYLFGAMLTSPIAQSPRKVLDCLTNWDGHPFSINEQQDAAEFCQLLIDRMRWPEPLFQVTLRRKIVGIDEPFEAEVEDHYNSLFLEVRNCSFMEQSLDLLHAPDFHTGKNQYYAPVLGRSINARSVAWITGLPNFLFVTLKRFAYNYETRTRVKLSTPFDFPFDLDLTQHCVPPETDAKYHITGIIVHSGSAEAGHYISLVTTGTGWCLINDGMVEQISVEQVRALASGRRDVNSSATVLVYTRHSYREPRAVVLDDKFSADLNRVRQSSMKHAVFTQCAVARFFRNISSRPNREIQIFVIKYFFTIFPCTRICKRTDWLISKLKSIENPAEAIADVDLAPGLLFHPVRFFREAVRDYLIGIEWTQPAFARLAAVVGELPGHFQKAWALWSTLHKITRRVNPEWYPVLVPHLREVILNHYPKVVFPSKHPPSHYYAKFRIDRAFNIWCITDPGAPDLCKDNDQLLAVALKNHTQSTVIVKLFGPSHPVHHIQSHPSEYRQRVFVGLLEQCLGKDCFEIAGTIFDAINDSEMAMGCLSLCFRSSSHADIVENLPLWFRRCILSPVPRARRLIASAIAGIVPHAAFEAIPLTREEGEFPEHALRDCLTDEERANAQTILEYCFELLLEVTNGALPERSDDFLPLDQYIAAELLELVWCLSQALDSDQFDVIHLFLLELVEHSQPYDPHVMMTLRILVRVGCEQSTALSFLRAIPAHANNLYNRACQCFEFLLPMLLDVPDPAIELFVSTFSFANYRYMSSAFAKIREFTELLIDRNPALVLSILDSRLDGFAIANLPMVVVVLTKLNIKRPILAFIRAWNCLETELSDLCHRAVACASSILDDPSVFVSVVEWEHCPRQVRRQLWAVAEANGAAIEYLMVKLALNNYNIGLKARLCKRGDESPLILFAVSSYRALSVAMDIIPGGTFDACLFGEDMARLILKRSYTPKMAERMAVVEKTTSEPKSSIEKLQRFARVTCSRRKFILEPYVRYARAVLPRIGKEKVSQFMHGYLMPIERKLRFVNDVMSDLKKDGLQEELDQLVQELTLIAEIAPLFDYGLIRELVENLQNPEVAAKIQSTRKKDLIELGLKCLERAQGGE
jgi:ubiquitin C-terminal hydrolase